MNSRFPEPIRDPSLTDWEALQSEKNIAPLFGVEEGLHQCSTSGRLIPESVLPLHLPPNEVAGEFYNCSVSPPSPPTILTRSSLSISHLPTVDAIQGSKLFTMDEDESSPPQTEDEISPLSLACQSDRVWKPKPSLPETKVVHPTPISVRR